MTKLLYKYQRKNTNRNNRFIKKTFACVIICILDVTAPVAKFEDIFTQSVKKSEVNTSPFLLQQLLSAHHMDFYHKL